MMSGSVLGFTRTDFDVPVDLLHLLFEGQITWNECGTLGHTGIL